MARAFDEAQHNKFNNNVIVIIDKKFSVSNEARSPEPDARSFNPAPANSRDVQSVRAWALEAWFTRTGANPNKALAEIVIISVIIKDFAGRKIRIADR